MKKKKVKEKKIHPKNPVHQDNIKLLAENSIALQRVVTNLALNLDQLSKQMERLLSLFENSAKSVAEKTINTETDTKRIIQKIK